MKTLLFAFAVVSFSSVVFSSPFQLKKQLEYGDRGADDDVEVIPRRKETTHREGFYIPFDEFKPPKLDFPDIKIPSLPSIPNFGAGFGTDDILTQDEIEKLKNRIFSTLPRIGGHGFFNSTFPRIDGIDNDFFSLKPLDLNPETVKNETIKDTKIVDGNVIETKESIYSSGDKTNGRVIRVKTVNVRPIESDKKTTAPPEATTKVTESNSVDHSTKASTANVTPDLIPERDVEVEFWMAQQQNVDDGEFYQVFTNEHQPSSMLRLENINAVNEPEALVYDLTKDTRVNEFVSSATIDPDSELVDVNGINQNDDRQKYYYSS